MLYKLNDKNRKEYSKVKRVTLEEIHWLEKDLQDLLSNNLQDFISSNDLMLICVEIKGQEAPDILAVDENGDLYIFELKRWSSKEENLLQVLRYGQLLGKSSYDELNIKYQIYKDNKNISLLEKHNEYFSKRINEEQFNRKQHFITVTNGLDQSTIEAIIYWRGLGLNIDAIVYWVYEIGEEHYIEFNTYSCVEDYLEYENNCYIINTDEKSGHTNEMLSNKKAAAYGDKWKVKIKKLQKGDLVFLYKSGTGIVAYGYADGVLKKAEHNGEKDGEYYMKLEKFVKLKKPISASEINAITQYDTIFMQTMFSIRSESAVKLLEEIKNNRT